MLVSLSCGLLAGPAAAQTSPAQAGTQLTVTSGDPIDWETCDAAGTQVGTAFLATGIPSYTPGSSDVGTDVCAVDASTLAMVDAFGPVAPGLVGAGPVLDTSQPVQGETLTVTPGDWDAGATVLDTWEDCDGAGVCDPVATGPSYAVSSLDVGETVEVVETATQNGASSSTSSPPTAQVVGVSPTVGGTPQVGDTLTAAPDDPTVFSYQWQQCSATPCTPIAGATSPTYVPGPADVGRPLEVVVGVLGFPGSGVPSPPTSAVVAAPVSPAPPPSTPPAPANLTAPAVTGAAALGQELTAGTGAWSGAPTGYAYRWLRCALDCVAIPDAVGATYRPVGADVGQSLAVEVTAENAGGSSPPKTSARTPTVTAASSLQIAASPARPRVNQAVDLVATVTSSAVGTAPQGSVSFSASGQAIAGCTGLAVAASGQTASASCRTSFPVSTPALSAAFTPATSSPLLASTSSTVTVAVQPGASTTSLDVSSEVTRGSSTTFTASVVAAGDLVGPVLPTGTVAFRDHGKTIHGCGAVRISDGGATCTARYPQTGSHSVTARYGGDADFRGSASRARTVRIVVPPPQQVLGRVTATMQWTFHYTPSYTQIDALVVHGAATGSTITIRCAGRGCPFASRTREVASPCAARSGHACPRPGTLDLEPSFRRRDLRIHARVVIMIRRHRYVGKYYRFLVRARTQPAVKITCLAPGSRTPGKGCASS